MTEVTRICRRELEGFVELVTRRKFKFYGHVVRGRGRGIASDGMRNGRKKRKRSTTRELDEQLERMDWEDRDAAEGDGKEPGGVEKS